MHHMAVKSVIVQPAGDTHIWPQPHRLTFTSCGGWRLITRNNDGTHKYLASKPLPALTKRRNHLLKRNGRSVFQFKTVNTFAKLVSRCELY